jgi:phenylacetic acid degradation operon negative regulatory protein
MLFTLFGVYIRHFGGEIWLSSLIRLMAEFGFSEQAVRAAIARLQNQGWVKTRRLGKNSYCSLTEKGLKRVDEAARRIYRLRREPWDGNWCLLSYTIPEEKREIRDQLRTELSWWGFGPLSTSTWISPHAFGEQMRELVDSYNLEPYVDVFYARHQGSQTNRRLAQKCWNLVQVNERYLEFLGQFEPLFERDRANLLRQELSDQACFVARSWLVHEYRKFLFIDPGLPDELLPQDWAGRRAVTLFYEYDQLLARGAGRFFATVFIAAPDRSLDETQSEQRLQAQLNPFSVAEPELAVSD